MDSPIRTAREIVDALKRNPAALKIAVAPLPGLNTHLAIAKPLKVAGVDVAKLTVVSFRSSADSMTALLGGHVDLVSATGPTVVPLVEAGKVRMVASAAPERGTGPLAQVPTWREQGIAADYVSYNGVLLPQGVNADQIRFWEAAHEEGGGLPGVDPAGAEIGQQAGVQGVRGFAPLHEQRITATQTLVAEIGSGVK
jgi:putative tricarboxylic transport membrane protein